MKRVILIADACIDKYHFGTVDRISPEAPVPIFNETHGDSREGMGDNVKNNLISMYIEIVRYFRAHTGEKHRYIDVKSKQQLLRVDQEVVPPVLDTESVLGSVSINKPDAIVVSDYDKGFISSTDLEEIERFGHDRSIPVFVDTKKRECLHLQTCFLKINESEYKEALKYGPKEISSHLKLIVTKGDRGASYREEDTYPLKHKVDVRDVTGAGDTFLSAFVCQYLHSKSIPDSIEFANKAASITVQKIGTYAPSVREVNYV